MKSNYEDLEKINDLYKRGVITEVEFNKEKEKILNNTGPIVYNKLFGLNENTYCLIIHLSLFLGFIHVILGLLVPFLLWVINKDHYASVDNHGRIVFNWVISLTIYMAILGLLLFPFAMFNNFSFNYSFNISSPFPLFSRFFPFAILMVLNIVFIIMGALKANSGILWNYPLSIRFIRIRK